MVRTVLSWLKKVWTFPMSLVDNIDDVAWVSSLDNDKILGDSITGSFTVGASSSPGSAGNIATETVAQSFGENVLPVMIWSTDDSSYQEAGSRTFTEGGSLTPNASATCYTTSTNLVLVGQNFTGSTQTIHYKAVLLSET